MRNKRPDIYCTLGNTTNTNDVIAGMIKAGMDGARINSAYCDTPDYQRWVDMVRQESVRAGKHIPIMMDIKGPQLRVLTANPKLNYSIEKGIVFPLGFSDGSSELTLEDEIDIYINNDIKDDIKEGDTILIENGTIVTRILENNDKVYVEVIDKGEGVIRNNMGINVPGRYLNLPHLTPKDEKVVDFSLQQSLEYLALSFTRDERDMMYSQDYILQRGIELGISKLPGIYAKVEDKFGYSNLQRIIDEVDCAKFEFGIMIGRGDMYNEVNYSKLAYIQQSISQKCRQNNVPVMIGTGFLESMKYNSRPTRAEICDVWNALRDNPDSIMLSAETSNSANPILTVSVLAHIIDEYYRLNGSV